MFLTHFLLIKNKKFSLKNLGFHYTNNCIYFKGEGKIPTTQRNLLDFPALNDRIPKPSPKARVFQPSAKASAA